MSDQDTFPPISGVTDETLVVQGLPSAPEIKAPQKPWRWSKIESIRVENFKAISDAEVTLGEVTILVGGNGSGKSSFLQAIHWAARASSYIKIKNGKEMIAFERMDYLPSSEPLRTAHKGELKSETSTAPTKILFTYASPDGEAPPTTTISIWAARNKGGVTAHIEGGATVSSFKQRSNFITTYIPGLAGLSERETILANPALRRQAASGDAGGVLRNILYSLSVNSDNNIDELNKLIDSVHPGLLVRVKYDDREDFYINAEYTTEAMSGDWRSLETAATGVLQVIQIFAYLILFRPRLMLIDEPDAHLHPDKQERLITALEDAAEQFSVQIILTTHSPNVLRGAGNSSKIIWMIDGVVKNGESDLIRAMMGWGGLDRDILFFIEDEKDAPIRSILAQWPELERRTAICRCFGVDNLPKAPTVRGLMESKHLGKSTLIHRDADFMTSVEISMWRKPYIDHGASVWVTNGSDVESYFCSSEYLSKLFDVDKEISDAWISSAEASAAKLKDFKEKRKTINRLLYTEDGGSPSTDSLWAEWNGPSEKTAVGKDLLGALKALISKEGFDTKRLDRYEIPNGHELASDLKALLISAKAKAEAEK